MKVVFCKISFMKYYKGVIEGLDEPKFGGKYVDEHGEGHEQYNFEPVEYENGDTYCLGFVETKSTTGTKRNELHIEKIDGCEMLKNEPSADNVLVVWCSLIETNNGNEARIVGWYKNATVYRNYQTQMFESGYEQEYNILAEKKNCVLLPLSERQNHKWTAPVAKKNTFGFGSSMLWFPNEEIAQPVLARIVDRIENYCGENWIDVSAYDI